mgnify:CR=1 FL=1
MQVIPYEEPSIQIDGPEPRGVLVVPVTLGANANIAVNANAFLNKPITQDAHNNNQISKTIRNLSTLVSSNLF